MNAWTAPFGLLDPVNGYTAQYLAGRLGVSQEFELQALSRRLDVLTRIVATRVRGYRGDRLEKWNKEVVPGPDGWTGWTTDDYCEIEPDPANPIHVRQLTIDIDAIKAEMPDPGCASVTITPESQCGTTVVRARQVSDCEVALGVCFPICNAGPGGGLDPPAPTGYLRVPKCDNGTWTCVAVPYWTCEDA